MAKKFKVQYNVDVTADPKIYQDIGPWVDIQRKYKGEVWAEEFGPFKPGQRNQKIKITEAVSFPTKTLRNSFIKALKIPEPRLVQL